MNTETMENVKEMHPEQREFFGALAREIPKNLGYSLSILTIEVSLNGINNDIIEFNVYAGDLLLRNWVLGEEYMLCYYESWDGPESNHFYIAPGIRQRIYHQFKNLTEDKVYYLS